MGDDLGVRFTGEAMPLGLQRGAQGGVILDDAVVDDGDPAGAVHVRMGVELGRRAVRGPAGVGDARRRRAPTSRASAPPSTPPILPTRRSIARLIVAGAGRRPRNRIRGTRVS